MNSAIASPVLQVQSLNSFILQMTIPGRGRGWPTQVPRSRQNNEDGGTWRAHFHSRAGGRRRQQSPSQECRVQRRQQFTNDDAMIQRPIAIIARAALPARRSLAQVQNIIANIRRALGRYHPPIIRRHYDCDCNTDSHARIGSFC
jgi:hypothetical protein